jgi:hypothetical protein
MITMHPYQQRVVEEKRDLDEKVARMVEFIDHSPVYERMARIDRGLLHIQLEAMVAYSTALAGRIERFKEKSASTL